MQLQEAKNLQYGDVLIFLPDMSRWRVNGQVKTWKKDPLRVQVPIKHGLYSFGYIDSNNYLRFEPEEKLREAGII